MSNPIRTIVVYYYNENKGLSYGCGRLLGIILKNKAGNEIAKIGDSSVGLKEVSEKALALNEGERLIGMKFGRRRHGYAVVFDI